MNIVDLSAYDFKFIEWNMKKFIYRDIIDKRGDYSYVSYYIYDIEKKQSTLINEEPIVGLDDWYSETIVLDKLYVEKHERDSSGEVFTSLLEISLDDFKVKEKFHMKIDGHIYILNSKYIIIMEDISESVLDFSEEKDIEGAYIKATLIDLEEMKEYEISSKKIRLGLSSMEVFTANNIEYLLLEESYYDLWDLEYYYNEGFTRENFIREGYKESLNIIEIEKLVSNIKNKEEIEFKVIHSTEYNENTRYFGMDNENIYFTSKNFDSHLEDIYKINKKDFNVEKIKTIDYLDFPEYTDVSYDILNQEIYYENEDENSIEITRLYDKFTQYRFGTMEGYRDGLLGIRGEYIILQGWYEDINGDNYMDYVRVINMKDNYMLMYENKIGEIIGGNLILFSSN